ncbi:N-acetylglucosamine-6-phosphate deacetylase [Geomicrobium sp. JCM 19037]|uniref:N-acetylglucosamine-6-phosphate deacetylase n=1 Tax=Geomicrobium sp. JCM 19037 TaxID=1460634 RepID=UPI00045F3B2A|nr:amidohydrolase family protein [Geomicrobium sp. JCM 19037]GAK02132.1 N-acetylglucosamine-6-phosphate deacetylase [Geomicrobium sp. JCM 19037]
MTHNKHVITGKHFESNVQIEVEIEGGVITAIKEVSDELSNDSIIAPGLVDLQVNGYQGVDFNHKPLDQTQWSQVIKSLAEVGVTCFYPTIITNSNEALTEIFSGNIQQLKCIEHRHVVGGFHLEGPFISCQDGPRGAHAKEHVRPPSWDEFCRLQEVAEGEIKMITLSPEWQEATDFIKRAVQSGVKIAIGHTAANSEQIAEAVHAGATLSTHLGNGAHPELPRHPNYLWDQLAEDELWASVIADGHHLPESVVKTVHRMKVRKMILISDSVALAGMKPGTYQTPVGGEVTLTSDGKLHLSENEELLAGSASHLLDGVKHCVQKGIMEFPEAWCRASVQPAKYMGVTQEKGIQIGAPADLVVLRTVTNGWEVEQTYKGGEEVFKKGE